MSPQKRHHNYTTIAPHLHHNSTIVTPRCHLFLCVKMHKNLKYTYIYTFFITFPLRSFPPSPLRPLKISQSSTSPISQFPETFPQVSLNISQNTSTLPTVSSNLTRIKCTRSGSHSYGLLRLRHTELLSTLISTLRFGARQFGAGHFASISL